VMLLTMSVATSMAVSPGVCGAGFWRARHSAVWLWPWVRADESTCYMLPTIRQELASAYPTSGALYYWAFMLAPKRTKRLVCWLTAWVLTFGQAANTAAVA
jgi:amino acid transporter